MDSNELRAACEMAGGELVTVQLEKYGAVIRVWQFPRVGFVEGHLGLPAYVAELLKAKIRRSGMKLARRMESMILESDGVTVCTAPAADVIRAAMAVLGGGE